MSQLVHHPRKERSMSKVWLITGGSRGLGRSLAEAVLAAGDRLVATARTPAQLADLADRYGDQVRTVALDVTDPVAAAAAVAVAVEAFGRLDVVVNNAGYANVGSIEDTPADDFQAQLATNLGGVINVTRAALPVLHAQRSGHFIQISTIGGRRAFPGLAAYHTAKFGVEGFSEALAGEVAPLGIKVTIVEPGGFRTDWAGSSMRSWDIHPDYEASVGHMRDVARGSGSATGDPAKAAQVLLRVAALEQPPLRLPLGSDAVELIGLGHSAELEEIARWAELSRSTDADDSEAFDAGRVSVGARR
jgi:NAD(P)-dependent dehydrogenase (short-subunit alcohol dehydrogenase family)